jgi:hypothetical protein
MGALEVLKSFDIKSLLTNFHKNLTEFYVRLWSKIWIFLPTFYVCFPTPETHRHP